MKAQRGLLVSGWGCHDGGVLAVLRPLKWRGRVSADEWRDHVILSECFMIEWQQRQWVGVGRVVESDQQHYRSQRLQSGNGGASYTVTASVPVNRHIAPGHAGLSAGGPAVSLM